MTASTIIKQTNVNLLCGKLGKDKKDGLVLQ